MTDVTRRVVLAAAMGVGMGANKETLAWDFGFPSIDDGRLDFAAFRGRVLLVTNTASFCGYTYQYEGLEKLHRAEQPRGRRQARHRLRRLAWRVPPRLPATAWAPGVRRRTRTCRQCDRRGRSGPC